MVLEINPINLSLNYGLWKTYEKEQNQADAGIFKKRFELLCETILSTGDGSSQKPYFVISPVDGMVIITKYLNKEITQMGSGEDERGYFLDILGYKDQSGDKTAHFVIDHSMADLSKILMEIRKINSNFP